jgi:hypothetical protein
MCYKIRDGRCKLGRSRMGRCVHACPHLWHECVACMCPWPSMASKTCSVDVFQLRQGGSHM